MLPRYLMVHGRKGLTQPESSPPFFFYSSTEVVSQCTQPKLGSFRLCLCLPSTALPPLPLSLLSLLTLIHQNPATNHLSTLAYVESLSRDEQLFFVFFVYLFDLGIFSSFLQNCSDTLLFYIQFKSWSEPPTPSTHKQRGWTGEQILIEPRSKATSSPSSVGMSLGAQSETERVVQVYVGA